MIRAASLFFLILAFSCVEPYQLPISDVEASSTMVVDGFINATTNIATVKLSFTSALSDTRAVQRLTKAKVWIEDENGGKTNLVEKEGGTYEAGGAFTIGKSYRLRIDRGTSIEYSSDYIEVTSTPPIDSVTWIGDDLDVVMHVTTHDPTNENNYYKWDFLETYEYSSPFGSKYKIVNGEAVIRNVDEYIDICWQTDASQDILATSIEQLTNKVVYKYPIHRLKGDDIKLWRLYSILVRQQSLTKDAYQYWSTLKKTTENLGGLFDPMPTEVKGNIRSSNPGELVLGYFYGGQVTEKRMFITFYDLPDNILHLQRKKECYSWTIRPNEVRVLDKRALIVGAITNILGDVVAYVVAYDNCVDCRVYRKGTLNKPSYWPPYP